LSALGSDLAGSCSTLRGDGLRGKRAGQHPLVDLLVRPDAGVRAEVTTDRKTVLLNEVLERRPATDEAGIL
jgi:hypothetical protein